MKSQSNNQSKLWDPGGRPEAQEQTYKVSVTNQLFATAAITGTYCSDDGTLMTDDDEYRTELDSHANMPVVS